LNSQLPQTYNVPLDLFYLGLEKFATKL
jgi:hypothetical protein